MLVQTASPSVPAPGLQLPVALLRFWADGPHRHRALEAASALGQRAEFVLLREDLLAVLPTPGQPAVFDAAIQLAQVLGAKLRREGRSSALAGLLVLPGRVRQNGGSTELVDEWLIDDLGQQAPELPAHNVVVTGYAASWLAGRYQFDNIGSYRGPSGRTLPLLRLIGHTGKPYWHNQEVLGRRPWVDRPGVDGTLRAAAKGGSVLLHGPLGCGKNRAIWHFLADWPGDKLPLIAGCSLLGAHGLMRRLTDELQRIAPEHAPLGTLEKLKHQEIAPDLAAQLLLSWLEKAAAKAAHRPWLVVDDAQSASPVDLRLLRHLVERAGPHSFYLAILTRDGGNHLASLPLPRVEVPPMDATAFDELSYQLLDGLSLKPAVEERFLSASAGYPLALEEGLIALVHRRLVRRVYGSFFFDGDNQTPYEASQRLVRFVESEIGRLGEPLPLRLLAAADQPIPPAALALTANSFTTPLAAGWERAFIDSGWLRSTPSAWGAGLDFSCPAFRQAVSQTFSAADADSSRRQLGRALTESSSDSPQAWAAYQLLAGSADSLPPLLQAARQASPTARNELLDALRSEYLLLRAAPAKEFTPSQRLDLLWSMLPLAHHLGQLAELGDELSEAVELAAEQPERFVALATLKAELDQKQGRFREAEGGLRQALAASSGSGERRRAMLFIRLGRLLSSQQRYVEAREIFESLRGLVDREGATTLGATCHFFLGNIALHQRRLAEAERHHELALSVRRQQGQQRPLGASLSALGSVAQAAGNYPQALHRYSEAETVLVAYGDDVELSFVLLGAGRVLGLLGDPQAASQPLRQALEHRSGRDDVAGEAIARLAWANNRLQLGKVDDALSETRRAHFDLSMLPQTSVIGDAEQLLGRCLMRQKPYLEAEQHLRGAISVHGQHGNTVSTAEDHSWLLILGLRQENLEAIREHCTALERLLDDLPSSSGDDELLYFRLFQGLTFLAESDSPIDSRPAAGYLQDAQRELMRKTAFLTAERRHSFLYNIRDHQRLLDAVTAQGLSWET